MKVLFLPNHDDNPYQLLLARALESHGASVSRRSPNGVFPVLGGIARNAPDVLHFHWLDQFIIGRTRARTGIATARLTFELLIAKLLGVSIVWTVHNVLQHKRRYPKFERYARKLFVRLCDEIIVHSPNARDRVMAAYDLSDGDEDRIAVIPHGNYVDSYENDVSKDEARDRLDIADGGTVYLFFGNVRSYKNVPALVKTFRTIDDEDARLVIAGNPPDDPNEEEALAKGCRADERVRTEFNYIPDDEVQLYMNAADAVVLPFSRVLTSGSVILAMSFGKPVIAPRLGCLPDLLGQRTELLYDPDDPDALRETMERARTLDLDALGEAVHERALSFEWDSIGERTSEVYRSATDGRPTQRRLTGDEVYDSGSHRSSETITDGGGKDSRNGDGSDETAGASDNEAPSNDKKR